MAKVLLVEDDNNLREIYEARLMAEGYDIVTAQDGEEALVVAKAEKPDLVVSDVMMPKISGFEMLDILRNTPELQGLKVIMLTALGQNDDQQRADRLGADRYLVKSQVTLEDIVNAARQLLDDSGSEVPEVVSANAESATPEPADPAPAVQPVAAPEAPTPPVAQAMVVPEAPAPAAPAPEPQTAAPAPAADMPAIPTPPAPPSPAQDAPAAAVPDAPAPVAPVPSPAPAPAPAPFAQNPAADTPAIDTTAAQQEVSNDARPAAAEEAAVEARIEDFVAGASSDAGAPAQATPSVDTAQQPTIEAPAAPQAAEPAVPPAPAPPIEPAPASPPTPAEAPAAEPTVTFNTVPSAASTSDNALLDNAVNNLVAGTPGADTSSPTTPAEAPAATPDASDNASTRKKVIIPIEGGPKPDLNQLLAEEEAKEASQTPGGTVNPTESDEDTPPPPKPASGGVDPNSIAL